MSYRAPVADIAFSLGHAAGLRRGGGRDLFGELSEGDVRAILEEAGRFASGEIAPLNRPGDAEGARLADGTVRMPAGWREVYRRWAGAGWVGLTGPTDHGGQNLPITISVAVQEMWNAASMAFGIGPVLTIAAADALHRYGSAELKARYLARLVSGASAGTMCLTEPHAGSDLGLLRCRAEPRGDGSYLIRGTKIFITYGEHDLTDNIVHMVLARLPDAPEGHRGISMFLVPKFVAADDGSPGARNDVRCVGLEHKLGLHASPTCTMAFGEAEGAVGWLIGEAHSGLACMFTMMNHARLMVGVQGVAVAERACQQALAFASERRQGRRPGMAPGETVPIIAHPDVRRSLMTMQALTQAARAICHETAHALDGAARARAPDERDGWHAAADLLTPVAKAFATDTGVEVASLGIQVHGGMGYVEETGAAQHLRDARIAPIYEGTNGIQAIDLAIRKLPMSEGATALSYVTELRATAKHALAADTPDFDAIGSRLMEGVDALEEATRWMLDAAAKDRDAALAAATPYLRLFGIVAGGCGLARISLAAARGEDAASARRRIATARFFAENICPQAGGLARIVTDGAPTILSDEALEI